MRKLTRERLLEVLSYDALAGTFTWRINMSRKVRAGRPAGSLRPTGYIGIGIDGSVYQAHRLAWFYVHGEWLACDPDHRNLVRTDNRLDNLRPATRSQNMANGGRRVSNVSGYKGVSYSRTAKRWVAQITKDYQNHYLGLFDTPEAAHATYVKKARELFGEFANDGCSMDIAA